MDVIALIGRILFVFLFFGSAMGHLTQTAAMAGYAASKGVPSAKAATFASGVLMFFGVYAGPGSELGLTVTGPLF
ncbi:MULTISPECIES: hypothetical protein [Saccharothrix]|uniref:hypothetical protein n=1 Tax=Saccharothrix TaxID=2071 RepID=UPI00093A1F9A|nr:hypothetical protein [Saccharothrix sp. CB00851]